jgi:hypothetical protein
MDFFFMEDLLSLVNFCLAQDFSLKEVNCSYKEKYFLREIAEIINSLGNHKVPILCNNNNSTNYIGKFDLPIPYIGLEKGIRSVYNILSNL